MPILALILSLTCSAQSVHLNKLGPDLHLKPIEGVKIQDAQAPLLNQQVAFQRKVLAKVEVKVKGMDFEAKEDLLEALEENSEADFIMAYPQFSAAEAKQLKASLYE